MTNASVAGDQKKTQTWLCCTLRAGGIALLVMLATGLAACKTKDPDENRYSQPRSYSKPHRDPVEQRIFYEGWRHPSR